MFRNQLTALFTHQRITTTVAKAKELRPMAERMVTLARTGTLANRRRVLEMISDREVVGRLFEEIAPRFSERPGGYTRIVRLGRRRGDNAELAIIEFVDYEPSFGEEDGGSGKTSFMDRAKGMFGRKSDEAAEPAAATDAADEGVEPEPVEDGPSDVEPEVEAPAEADDDVKAEAAKEAAPVDAEPPAEPSAEADDEKKSS
jgi:large subunit ribosomal protein L17